MASLAILQFVGRWGTILLLVAFASGVLLATGVVSPAHGPLRLAIFIFIVVACPIGAGLVTASFARTSLKYYKARAERRRS